jgi:hypothetical protein
MQKVSAVLGSAPFFVVAPCVLAGLIPWWMTRWEFQPTLLGLEVTRAIGVLLILVGLPGLVDSFARFALQGLGTPAPVAPTKNLVVTWNSMEPEPRASLAATLGSRLNGPRCPSVARAKSPRKWG